MKKTFSCILVFVLCVILSGCIGPIKDLINKQLSKSSDSEQSETISGSSGSQDSSATSESNSSVIENTSSTDTYSFSSSDVSYEAFPTATSLAIIFKNESSVMIPEIIATVVYYDASGAILSSGDVYVDFLEPGQKAAETVYYPYDSDYKYITYDHADISLEIVPDIYSAYSVASQLEVQSNIGADNNVMAQITNNTGHNIYEIELACVFYSAGTVVGISFDYDYPLNTGITGTYTFYAPYDSSWSTIAYDDYEIIINEAYYYE